MQRGAPAVHDVATYVEHRVDPQIRWYRGRSAGLASAGSPAPGSWSSGWASWACCWPRPRPTWRLDDVAAWVAVVTTLAAALSSHVAASRWEYQLVEYLRTAAELGRLREEWAVAGAIDEAAEDRLVERCEHVVSIQNDGWMAKWAADQS